jgi:hypothetical protein
LKKEGETMSISNYDIMKNQMQAEFLKYDQPKMIDKFSLKHDADYLYLPFVGQEYRIDRQSGLVEALLSEDDKPQIKEAGFEEAMSIYDLLCCSKDSCQLSGEFVSLNRLPGTVHSSVPGTAMFREAAEFFDQHLPELPDACEALGGTPEKVGDVAYRLPVFDFLDVQLQFWASDEEFQANLQFLWDRNIQDFIHYETTFYVAGHLIRRLQEQIKE